ncbi:hypothetical protein [Catenulispora rubra]|uniref:hypothetical protein n=1 Tax=Catenulispora rubra TaxID=280293 RepID=UPI001892619C|nr:hypothetical protein [Catenulispora rubra]
MPEFGPAAENALHGRFGAVAQAGLFRCHRIRHLTKSTEDAMNITPRTLATGIAAATGVALIAAGPVMICI